MSIEDDSVALVGAYAVENYRGAAYVFRSQQGTWTETDTLQASDGTSGSVYGYYSAIAGKTALVGSYTANVDNEARRGAAYFHTHQDPSASKAPIAGSAERARQGTRKRSVTR